MLVARGAGKLEELRTALLDHHPALIIDVIAADLSEPGSAAEVARKAEAAGRRIDVLINNAGSAFHGQFAEEGPEHVASQIQLNAGSVADLTARFLPPMLQARHGLVINVASTAAFQPVPTMAVYAATKAFVLSLTEALWQETRGSGVRVLALCPGATETGFFAAAAEQPFMTRGRQNTPAGRPDRTHRDRQDFPDRRVRAHEPAQRDRPPVHAPATRAGDSPAGGQVTGHATPRRTGGRPADLADPRTEAG